MKAAAEVRSVIESRVSSRNMTLSAVAGMQSVDIEISPVRGNDGAYIPVSLVDLVRFVESATQKVLAEPPLDDDVLRLQRLLRRANGTTYTYAEALALYRQGVRAV